MSDDDGRKRGAGHEPDNDNGGLGAGPPDPLPSLRRRRSINLMQMFETHLAVVALSWLATTIDGSAA